MSDQYLIVLAIEPMPMGGVFAPGVDLPQHCTLIPWFYLERGRTYRDIAYPIERFCGDENFKGASSEYAEIQLVAGTPGVLGLDHDIPVYLLHENVALTRLHFTILRLLDANVVHLRPEWIGAGWNPHVTVTDTGPFTAGSVCIPCFMYVVRKDVEGFKHVYGLYPLLPSAPLTPRRNS